MNQENKSEQEYFFNNVTLVGRAGRDAELKYFDSGTAKAELSLAVNRGRSKNREEITDWFKVVLWGRQAEIAGEYVKKGSLIGIEGTIEQNKWIDESSGEQRETYFIKASSLKLIGGKKDQMAHA
ncbi:MAG: single-stranded DNA-binding protein [Candidatus Caenarcaniphilales bacterium]|nr:single-stranded DNA-binding protein [Candidatus Caenarcaniphilales bacterium]